MGKFERCTTCRFKIEQGKCRNCGAIVARVEVASNPPKLRDFHEVEESLEPTLVLDMPPDYAAMFERHERATIPLPYHPIAPTRLEELIAKRAR
jgi:hypothetical protein